LSMIALGSGVGAGAAPQYLVAVLLPVSFKLVRRRRKWDKENRSRWDSATDVDLPRSEPETELLVLKIQSPLRLGDQTIWNQPLGLLQS
jgi:hypothetical protein